MGTVRGNVVVALIPDGNCSRVTEGVEVVLLTKAVTITVTVLLGMRVSEEGERDKERTGGLEPGPDDCGPPPHDARQNPA
jgi:hypothetical protein